MLVAICDRLRKKDKKILCIFMLSSLAIILSNVTIKNKYIEQIKLCNSVS